MTINLDYLQFINKNNIFLLNYINLHLLCLIYIAIKLDNYFSFLVLIFLLYK